MTIPTIDLERRRHWRRLHASTYVVLLAAAAVLFFSNVPAAVCFAWAPGEDVLKALTAPQAERWKAEKRLVELVKADAGRPELIEPLIRSIELNPEGSGRRIGILQKLAEHDASTFRAFVPRLAKLLGGNSRSWVDEDVVFYTIDLLGRIGTEAGLAGDRLREIAYKDEDIFYRIRALAALVRIDENGKHLEALHAYLSNEYKYHRTAAVVAMLVHKIRDDESLRRLTTLLDDPRVEVRVAAAMTLARFGKREPKVFDVLTRSLDEEGSSIFDRKIPMSSLTPSFVTYSFAGLADFGAEAAPIVPRIRKFLKDEDGGTRQFAVISLSKIGLDVPGVRDALEEASRDRVSIIADEAKAALRPTSGKK